jgi:carbonic anhydrase/acetyltransferase-like protein (isoleucine patch superfamily)
VIGSNVVVGHGAILGAVTVEDDAHIGMGAKVRNFLCHLSSLQSMHKLAGIPILIFGNMCMQLEDGAIVQKGAYVAPGSVVPSKVTVTAGHVSPQPDAELCRSM